MNKKVIYSKLREICSKKTWCHNCPIESINPDHKCGCGYGYFLSGNPVPLEEALYYYLTIFEKQNLRVVIEKRKESRKHERRI